MSIDPKSETWRAVLKHAEDEIEAARGRLESQNCHSADIERGIIMAMRQLMNLDRPPIEVGQTVPY